jgi:hypothetical protein
MSGGFHKGGIFATRDRIPGEGEGIHPYAVYRPFVVGTGVASHEEVAGGDGHEVGHE